MFSCTVAPSLDLYERSVIMALRVLRAGALAGTMAFPYTVLEDGHIVIRDHDNDYLFKTKLDYWFQQGATYVPSQWSYIVAPYSL